MTMGSKEGLASMATAMIGPGDVVLAPNPSYPIHTIGFIIGGIVLLMYLPIFELASSIQ